MRKRRRKSQRYGVWCEPKEQALRDLAEVHANHEKEINEGEGSAKARHKSRSSSATGFAFSDDQQQLLSYPAREETAEVVDTVCETVEKSRRSDTFGGTAVGV